MAYNTIFLWPFLKTIKASMMTKKSALVSGILGDQFKLGIMAPQRSKEPPKNKRDYQFHYQSQSQRHKIILRAKAAWKALWN